MNRLLNTIWLLLLCPVLMLGQGLQRYEYWVDEDYSQHKTVNSNSAEITLSIDVGNQQIGLHYLNFRAQNTDGEWGSVNRYLYYIPEPPATVAPLKGYEYWLDDQTANRQYVNSNSESVLLNIDVSQLSVGVHYINFRSQNSREEWGMVNRYLFYVPELADPTAGISQYEYWIDDDYSKAQRVTTSETNMLVSMDISQLPVGVHYYNFRAKNTRGEWGNISRLLFYVPDEPDDSQGSPLVGYTYNFNQQATYVGIGEQTSYELKDYVITIPDLVEIGNLVTGCTFTFNADGNFAHLERTQLVSFALQFKKKNGSVSAPAATSFTMSDALTRQAKPLSTKQSATYDKVPIGDFAVFRIDATEQLDAHLNTTQQCSVWLYDASGRRVNSYQRINAGSAVSMNLSAGTYFGIVYEMVKDNMNPDNKLTLSLTTSQVDQTICDSDDLMRFILSLTRVVNDTNLPPLCDEPTIDGDVEVDNVHLTVDGTNQTPQPKISFYGGNIIIQQNASMTFKGVSFASKDATAAPRRAAGSGGGIKNSGTLTFKDCIFHSGDYTLENSGKVLMGGVVKGCQLVNKHGGRIHVTSSLTDNVKVVVPTAADVEQGVAIITGVSGIDHIQMSLPSGYAYKYDATAGGIVVYFTTSITSIEQQTDVDNYYDISGRKVDIPTKGLTIRQMKDGTIKKVITK